MLYHHPRPVNLSQALDLDVSVENRRAAMFALKADASPGSKLGHGAAEPGRDLASVGVRFGQCPSFDIGIDGDLAVKDYGENRALAGHSHPVPRSKR